MKSPSARGGAQLLACLLATLSMVACGDDPDTRIRNDPRCASTAPSCLARHEGCVFTDDGPVCEACPLGQRPSLPNGDCVAFATDPLAHTFGPFDLAVGEELEGECESWVLDNAAPINVDAMLIETDGAFHHSVLFWVPEDFADWPLGRWEDCYNNGFDEVMAATNGGVLVATSTEVDGEVQVLPTGTAYTIPPRSRIIAAMHLLNDTGKAKTTAMRVKLKTVSSTEVSLAPSQLVMPVLDIPGDVPSTFTGSCDVAAAHQAFANAPLTAKIHGFLPHFHPATTSFQVTVVGGPEDGRKLVDFGPYEPMTLGVTFDPPVDLTGATGLALTCSYDPSLAADPSWGNGHEQKCETLLLVESAVAFAGVIVPNESTPAPVNGVHTWPCQVLTFPYPPVSAE